MRYLFALITGFVALSLYLEQSQPALMTAEQAAPLQKVVRANSSTTEASVSVKTDTTILNLALPQDLVDRSQLTIPSQHAWQNTNRSERERIRYEAELVYDLEKGEDITGGKVSILIPFG